MKAKIRKIRPASASEKEQNQKRKKKKREEVKQRQSRKRPATKHERLTPKQKEVREYLEKLTPDRHQCFCYRRRRQRFVYCCSEKVLNAGFGKGEKDRATTSPLKRAYCRHRTVPRLRFSPVSVVHRDVAKRNSDSATQPKPARKDKKVKSQQTGSNRKQKYLSKKIQNKKKKTTEQLDETEETHKNKIEIRNKFN